MFRPTDRQHDMFSAAELIARKRAACEKSWAGPFRERALPILLRAEAEFAGLYDDETGRPNRSVALVLGTLILKEVKDLTDEETLEALEFDLRWHYAFDLKPEESRLCQKTLHNFRAKLLEHDKGAVIFRQMTDELISALGVRVDRQRLDSTHILSNFAKRKRLDLFCETMRVFLRALKKQDAGLFASVPAGALKRYAEESHYADARSGEGTRRLCVAGRDVYRLVDTFKGHPGVSGMAEYALLVRLFEEQCEVTEQRQRPKDDDDDQGEGPVPVKLKDPRSVSSESLQTPHDPDATYSGHKGKGYSVQMSETCVAGNPLQLITHVAVTPASVNDAKSTIPVIDALNEAGHTPGELVADTSYSGAKIASDASRRGVNLLAPAPAGCKPEPEKAYPAPEAECPKTPQKARAWLIAQEAQSDFKERYAIRAGIEATHSEFKRAHGARKLRVRGGERVGLAVYLKATACNLKRALRYWLQPPGLILETAASLA